MELLSNTARWFIGGCLAVAAMSVAGAIYKSIDVHDAAPDAHLKAITVEHNDDPDAHLVMQREMLESAIKRLEDAATKIENAER